MKQSVGPVSDHEHQGVASISEALDLRAFPSDEALYGNGDFHHQDEHVYLGNVNHQDGHGDVDNGPSHHQNRDGDENFDDIGYGQNEYGDGDFKDNEHHQNGYGYVHPDLHDQNRRIRNGHRYVVDDDGYGCHSFSVEGSAKLESCSSLQRGGLSQMFASDHSSPAVPAPRLLPCRSTSMPLSFFKQNLLCRGRSFSTDLDRELAWQRKKELYWLEEQQSSAGFRIEYENEEDDDSSNEDDKDSDVYYDACESEDDNDDGGDTQSEDDNNHGYGSDVIALNGINKTDKDKDVPSSPTSTTQPLIRTRTKSLTDEDLEELRGSIDLGFGFSHNETCNLKSTLPALELYYAITRNFEDAKCRSSPVSPLDGNLLVRANSEGSTSSPGNETWRISSPGDHPSQVKARLRHWAQAVACSVKQTF